MIKGKSFICTIEVRSLRSGATGAFNTNMEDKHIIVIRVMRQNFCAGFCCKKLHQNSPQNIATSHFVPPCNEFNSNQTITLSTSTNQINAYKIFLYTFKHFVSMNVIGLLTSDKMLRHGKLRASSFKRVNMNSEFYTILWLGFHYSLFSETCEHRELGTFNSMIFKH